MHILPVWKAADASLLGPACRVGGGYSAPNPFPRYLIRMTTRRMMSSERSSSASCTGASLQRREAERASGASWKAAEPGLDLLSPT